MLSNDLRQLEMWSDLWRVTSTAAKTEVLTITHNPSLHPPLLRFCNQALNETTSHKHLGLIFHLSLTWHLHISTLHHRAMSIVNAVKKIKNFLPGIHFLYSIVHMFCPSLIMVILFLIIVRLLTLISLKAFKLLQLKLSVVALRPHPMRLF